MSKGVNMSYRKRAKLTPQEKAEKAFLSSPAQLNEYLESTYEEVDYSEFYRDIFPAGSLEKKGEYVEGDYNAIAIAIHNKSKRVKRYTVTDDLEMLDNLVEMDDYFVLLAPASYIGKTRHNVNARDLYALAIDVDGIKNMGHQRQLFKQITKNIPIFGLPVPTYIVSSGSGLHLYYVFKERIRLFPSSIRELEKLKRRLTWQAWTQGGTTLKNNIQYESLLQGFRMVGTRTKKGGITRAFRTGEKVDIDYLNSYVRDQDKALDLSYKSKLPLSVAKKRYPEWYQKRIVEGRPKQTWTCNRAVYDWWKRRAGEVKEGHRYWYIVALATYAKKCNISKEELLQDAIDLADYLDSISETEFTESDALTALAAYDDKYMTYPINSIVFRTGLPIEKNKRNFRKQADHIKIITAIRDVIYPNNEWAGRKPKKDIVEAWKKDHPNGKKADCIRDTGLSKPTVYKWW